MSFHKSHNFAVCLQSSAPGALPLGESTNFHVFIDYVSIAVVETNSMCRVGPPDTTIHPKAWSKLNELITSISPYLGFFYSPSYRQSLITLCSQYWSHWPKPCMFQLWSLCSGEMWPGTHHTPRLAMGRGVGEVHCLLLLTARLQAPDVQSWDCSATSFSAAVISNEIYPPLET